MTRATPTRASRRRALGGAGALLLVACLPARAEDPLPSIPSLATYLAGRVPRRERIKLAIPALADNGFAVPMRITVAGPFAPGAHVKSLRVFSETNPVPDVAVFEFPQPLARIELDSRIRLAGTQRIVAVAELADGTVYAAATEVVVTLAGCMDGT